MKNIFLSSALAMAFLLANGLRATPSLCGGVAGNIVTNCGFETATLSGWTATPTGYLDQYYGVDTVDAKSGTYGAYLAGQSSSVFLSQVLPTVTGTTYYITFYLAHPDVNIPPYDNSFNVSFGSDTLYSESDLAFGYRKYIFSDTATSEATTLQFGALDPLNFFSLDDVAVYVAPEPSTVALALPVLVAGLLLLVRRRKVGPLIY